MARAATIGKQRLELRGADAVRALLGNGPFRLGDHGVATVSVARDLVIVEGMFGDRLTAIPHERGPRWMFGSGYDFDQTWAQLAQKLAPLAPTAWWDGDRRDQIVPYANGVCQVTLYRGEPDRWFVAVALGEIVEALQMDPGVE
ncbi:MAG: hypothetical protein QM831_25270 [Kofleriaceae bacterium]